MKSANDVRGPALRICAGIAFGFALMLLAPERGFACSCSPTPTVAEELERADAVFSGEVTKLEVLPSWWQLADEEPPPELLEPAPGPADRPIRTLRVTFAVVKVWKGPSDPTIVIHSSVECCLCGRSFDAGRAYLVYAFREKDGRFSTNACVRGGPQDQKPDDLAQLGAPSTDYDSPRREKLKRRALGED